MSRIRQMLIITGLMATVLGLNVVLGYVYGHP